MVAARRELVMKSPAISLSFSISTLDFMKFHSETQISLERDLVDPTWEHPPTASLAALRTQVQTGCLTNE